MRAREPVRLEARGDPSVLTVGMRSSTHTPADIRKAASMVLTSKPKSLTQRLKGAIWGEYRLHEGGDADGTMSEEEGGSTRLPSRARRRTVIVCANCRQVNELYPNAIPSTIRYRFECRPEVDTGVGAAGSNAKLYLVAHSVASEVRTASLRAPLAPLAPLCSAGAACSLSDRSTPHLRPGAARLWPLRRGRTMPTRSTWRCPPSRALSSHLAARCHR